MLKTAECVTPKHPDKICDIISDAILDECLRQDPNSRVAIETMGGHGIVSVTGEITMNGYVDVKKVVCDLLDDKYGVQVNIVSQSPNIARGVDTGGAGDQGIMVGYACNENKSMIPQELYLARDLCKFIYFGYEEDGKTQITLEDGKIHTVVASFCNVIGDNLFKLIDKWLLDKEVVEKPLIFVNPAGEWDIGGFEADTGLTGRKLAVDNYGPQIPIGGGAFSGKDPSKVDRSGAYKARQLAVQILNGLKAKEVIVKLAYSIGLAKPVMATAIVDGKIIDIPITKELEPNEIIKSLDLKKPQYEVTAEWGHFGNNFKWDK